MTADAAADLVLSTGRPALASSTGRAAHAATEGVDGDTRSRWASVAGAGAQ